jgi:tRNA A37 threonylcarbamoyladenosine biosynthesis protein TsaE
VIIEWAEIIKKILPPKILNINIIQLGEENRKLVFGYPKELGYLMKGITS